MAEKKVMIVTVDEINNNLVASDSAVDAYQFALANAGIEMDEGAIADFVVRRNAKGGWHDLWEFKAWCEKTAASIKEVCKHTFNCGTDEELPANVKWAKQSYTQKFQDGAAAIVAKALVAKRMVTTEALLNLITPSQLSKVCGLTVEKIMDMYPDTIIQEPKERTLTIK